MKIVALAAYLFCLLSAALAQHPKDDESIFITTGFERLVRKIALDNLSLRLETVSHIPSLEFEPIGKRVIVRFIFVPWVIRDPFQEQIEEQRKLLGFVLHPAPFSLGEPYVAVGREMGMPYSISHGSYAPSPPPNQALHPTAAAERE
jgi:hypothetical protein